MENAVPVTTSTEVATWDAASQPPAPLSQSRVHLSPVQLLTQHLLPSAPPDRAGRGSLDLLTLSGSFPPHDGFYILPQMTTKPGA